MLQELGRLFFPAGIENAAGKWIRRYQPPDPLQRGSFDSVDSMTITINYHSPVVVWGTNYYSRKNMAPPSKGVGGLIGFTHVAKRLLSLDL
jgi:hypothetical protein